MKFLIAISLPLLAVASPVDESALLTERQSPILNATVEYRAQCKTCPWNLCTNVVIADQDQVVNLTCWTEGELIDDTRLWLKTGDNCYLPEYDLIDNAVDYREELPYCGRVPQKITRQAATTRYLTGCNWQRGIGDYSLEYYGRDLDLTLTCWAEGTVINGNAYWYKTTDNCHVPGANLWGRPVLDGLDNCGPAPPTNLNVSRVGSVVPDNDDDDDDDDDDEIPPTTLEDLHERDGEKSIGKRWLNRQQIGEEYAPCQTCPTATRNSTCGVQKVYEFDDWVVSQCTTREDILYPNGTLQVNFWMLTTDWCYVEGDYFWVPPWDLFRYSQCSFWEGY